MDFTLLKNFMDDLTAWRIPGNDCSVWLDGKEVFRYQSGYSDLENKIRMTDDKMFNIYSCSKPATVTAGLQLYERGKFLLDDPLYDFINEFKEMRINTADGDLIKAKNPITLRHLFSMQSGFNYDYRDAIEEARKLTDGRMETVETIKCVAKHVTLSFEPGTKWQYGISHDVLAAVIEVISGKKFRDYVRENIFEPLGMYDTAYHYNDRIMERLCPQYHFYEDDGEERTLVEMQSEGTVSEGGCIKRIQDINTSIHGPEYDSGGSGVITSVSDYVKFVNALANWGKGATGERILSRGGIELLRTNQTGDQILPWSQLKGYGYGLGVRTMIDKAASGSIGSIGEFGWGGAAGATVLADPERRLAVFYTHHMCNPQETYYQPRLRNVVYACLD